MSRKKPYPKLIDVSDLITQTIAARIRGVSRPAIRDLVRRRRIQSIEISGTVFVFRSEVAAFTTGTREKVRKMSNDDVLAEVERVARLLGHLPTSFEYKEHGQIHLSTLCRRFGGWPKVREAAQNKMKKRNRQPALP